MMRVPRSWARSQPRSTSRHEPAYCRYSGRHRPHRGDQQGDRSGTARLSPLADFPSSLSLVLAAPLLRFECSASEVSNKSFPVSSENWLGGPIFACVSRCADRPSKRGYKGEADCVRHGARQNEYNSDGDRSLPVAGSSGERIGPSNASHDNRSKFL